MDKKKLYFLGSNSKTKKNSSTFNLKHCFSEIFQVHKKIKCNSSNSRNSGVRPHWIEKLSISFNFNFFSHGESFAVSKEFQVGFRDFSKGNFFSGFFRVLQGFQGTLATLFYFI